MVYRTAFTKRPEQEELRSVFAVQLGSLIKQQKRIIYMDETSTHAFQYLKKSWSLQDCPNEVPINNKRLGCTVFGAIGTALVKPCISIEKSTNKEAFLTFLKLMKRNLRDPNSKELVYLVMDNHKSHKSCLCREFLEENFVPVWLPSGTPQFNSIESLWSPFKQQMKKVLLDAPMQNKTQVEFEDIVRKVATKVAVDHSFNMLRANRRYIYQRLSLV